MGKSDQQKEPRVAPNEGIQYRKNKYAAPIGGIFVLLAVVGLIAVGIFCVRFTQELLDNTSEKQKFESIITPVLMFDPPPFETPVNSDPLFLLQSSLWSALLGEKRASYQVDEIRGVMVPASDVDVACARLFGSEIKLVHQSFSFNYVDNYIYDTDTKTYYAPVTGQVGLYSPSVERVVKKGDLYTLTIGYIPPTNAWTQAAAGETGKPEPDKRMLYEMQKVKDHYQLLSLRDIPMENAMQMTSGETAVPQNASELAEQQK